VSIGIYAALSILVLLGACGGPTSVDGQAVGYVIGEIADASGAGVPGARVEIEGLAPELDPPRIRATTTDAAGQYSVLFSAFLRSEVTSAAIISVTAPVGSGLRDTVVSGVSFTVNIQADTAETTVDITLSP